MSQYNTRILESRAPGPAVTAAGDGMEGIYAAVVTQAPSGGVLQAILPGLDQLHALEVSCSNSEPAQVGDTIVVAFDDQKDCVLIPQGGSAAPHGAAGGVLSGTYPNPGFANTPLKAASNLSDLTSRTSALANLGVARGAAQITVAANTNFTIAHGLGAQPASFMAMSDGIGGNPILKGVASDVTNLTLSCSVSLTSNFILWIALL